MSVTAKVQNLIDLINNCNGTEQEEKESIRYLESAPQPQASTADIDASKIKIVVLGCGLVVPPLIEYLNFYGYQIIIATRTVSRADAVIARVTNPQLIRVEKLDFSNSPSASDALLDRLCNEGDVIISLLPYIYHVKAAQVALKYGKHFCTTSYISPEMEALRQQVEAKKLCFLNECGVDPGLDHMSAMKIIDEVHDNGGRIVSFTSICGGLPAPEFNDNPFGYKFSWAPKGVLLASRNSARQFIGGQIVDIPGVQLFAAKNVFKQRVKLIGDLEWYYNRDSCQYIDHYGIQEISTMIRVTFHTHKKFFFSKASGAHTKHEHHSEQDEYHLLAALINTQHTNRYLFSAKCIELAQRLYNLRNHLIYWTRSKKQMSFKSVNHYMNAAKQFIEALQNHPQFQYIQFCKHFKVAQLNLDVLHQQFLSHRAKDVHQREKHGNLRKALDTAYDEYRCYTSTRTKWFLAGMLSTIAVIVWLVRNVDLDDIQDPEPAAQSRKR